MSNIWYFSQIVKRCNQHHGKKEYNYIIGEIVARLQKDVIELKTKIKIDTAITQTEERKKYIAEVDSKPPAYDHAEAYPKTLELLRIGYHVQNHAHVLSQPVFFL